MHEVLNVGDPIRSHQTMELMPVGSVISESRNRWTKQANGLWFHTNGGTWGPNDFSMNGANRIYSFPDGTTSLTVPIQTVERVKWAFRTGALAQAEAHGVSLREVESALGRMGAGKEDVAPTIGRGVKIANAHDREALPEGSIIYSGSPQQPGTLAVFAKKNRNWVHILGEQTFLDGVVTVESYGGNRERPAWLDREGTEQDAEQIQEFKARAWRVGYELKRQHGWCGTYEDIVHRLGVTEADTRRATHGGFAIGTRITAEQAATLPVGSMFWWQHSNNTAVWGLFQRVEQATNRAGTMKIAGSDEADHENYKRYMTVGGIPDRGSTDAAWTVPLQPAGVFDALPPGTVLTYRGGGEQRYIKCADGNMQDCVTPQAIPAQGRYRLSQFGDAPQWVVRSFVR